MTYDWSLYTNEIVITWKYHGLLFGKSLSQLKALEVLEQGEELRSFTSRNIVWLNHHSKHSQCSRQRPRRSVWRAEMKVQQWNWQIRKSGAKFATAMWKFRSVSHSEHDSHFFVGLFGAEQLQTTSYWRRWLQKNDTMEVALQKDGFLLVLTKTHSKWLKFWLVQLLLKHVHPKLHLPFWTDGFW